MSTVNRDYIVQQIRKFVGCHKGCSENFYYGRGCKACAWSKIIEIVENAPEADAVEVVRCGKCKNAIPRQEDDFDGMPPYYCPFVSDYVRDNDFCCHGERRSDETD